MTIYVSFSRTVLAFASFAALLGAIQQSGAVPFIAIGIVIGICVNNELHKRELRRLRKYAYRGYRRIALPDRPVVQPRPLAAAKPVPQFLLRRAA